MTLEKVQYFIEQENLFFIEKDKILLGVSGGMDSVVMVALMHQMGVDFSIAHCNFQLRGDDSVADAQFVEALAKKYDTKFYLANFDTTSFQAIHKISTQEAARQLRYEWLEKIRQEFDYQYLAVGHHADDNIETMLHNFAKGCGLSGLRAMLPKREAIVRPLLCLSRAEIEEFAKQNLVEHREDASNLSDKYTRNKIRHHVVPPLRSINPNLSQVSVKTFQILRESEFLMNCAVETFRQEYVVTNLQSTVIQLDRLKKNPAAATLLYEFLKSFGFNNSQVTQMLANENSGKVFFTATHKALIDRGKLWIETPTDEKELTFSLAEDDTLLRTTKFYLATFSFENKGYTIGEDNWEAALDFERLTFPLTIRHWKSGDYFFPLGMKGKKQKLQDYFSNKKMSNFDKEKVWIVESGGQICWVVGHRIDERFKIAARTNLIYKIKFGTLGS